MNDKNTSSAQRPAVHPLATLASHEFQIEFRHHARAILSMDFPQALAELDGVIGAMKIPIESLVRGGGGEHELTQGLRTKLAGLGWAKHKFEFQKLIDGKARSSVTHEIDHVRVVGDSAIALELEWNNKDPFFDRDLENFNRLHAEGAISVGVIVTRGESFQKEIAAKITAFAMKRGIKSYDDLKTYDLAPTPRQAKNVERRISKGGTFAAAWAELFVQDKFGEATTHWRKLLDRIGRGVGSPCPLLLIGIPASALVDYEYVLGPRRSKPIA